QIPVVILTADAAMSRQTGLDTFEPGEKIRRGVASGQGGRNKFAMVGAGVLGEPGEHVHLDPLLHDRQSGEVASGIGKVRASLAKRLGDRLETGPECPNLLG